jgi:Potassium-transporting ATPase A subunit
LGYRNRDRHLRKSSNPNHRAHCPGSRHGSQKTALFGLGTMRDDTPAFAFLLMGTIVIIGALLFLPVAALGPVVEHLGPMPFGR